MVAEALVHQVKVAQVAQLLQALAVAVVVEHLLLV
jgi:hypothetical protein